MISTLCLFRGSVSLLQHIWGPLTAYDSKGDATAPRRSPLSVAVGRSANILAIISTMAGWNGGTMTSWLVRKASAKSARMGWERW